MASDSSSSSSLRCVKPECNATFSTKSNLNRHIKSKHGPKVQAACGKEFPNQPWNIKRHMSACSDCKRKKDDSSTSSEKQPNDADTLNIYDFLFEGETADQYDSISGDIGDIDILSLDYGKYPFDLGHE
ncbi:hypothetical protein RB213_002591 [Colletotrichum asianum]